MSKHEVALLVTPDHNEFAVSLANYLDKGLKIKYLDRTLSSWTAILIKEPETEE